MAGSFEPAKTGNSAVDRNFRELAQLLNSIQQAAPYQAAVVTRDYQATGFEGTIHVDASRGPVRVTLPKPSVFMPPLIVRQVNLTGKHGGVTIAATGAKKTIAGASTYALDDTGTGSATFTSDGVQHWPGATAGGNPPSPSSALQGPPGPAGRDGKDGAPGAPGSPVRGFPLVGGGNAPSRHDASGAEVLSYGWAVPFSRMPVGIVTVILCFYASSALGAATFKARLSGTYRGVDGTVLTSGVGTSSSSTLAPVTIVATGSNPGADDTIKLTQQSSGSGHDCEVDQCVGMVLSN